MRDVTAAEARPGARTLAPPAGLTAILVALYVPVLGDLATLWAGGSYYYAYGIWVPVWSAAIAWSRRSEIAAARRLGDRRGLLLVAAGAALLTVGRAQESLSLAVLSLPLSVAGLGLSALGWPGFRPLAFPVGFLGLMTPLPASAFPALAAPLQQLAASFTEIVLRITDIPFAREGLYFHVGAMTLHVAEACSGLRFAMAMVVLGVALAWATDRRLGARVLIAVAAVVLAIAANLVRVSTTIALVHFYGAYVAAGTFHNLFGKAVYLAAVILCLLGARALKRRRWPDAGGPRPGERPGALAGRRPSRLVFRRAGGGRAR